MNEQFADLQDTLIREITRYLVAVEVFRAEQCEPTWLRESTRRSTVDEAQALLATTVAAPSVH